MIYLDGIGVKKDIAKGLSFLDEGIENESSYCKYQKGYILSYGLYGVKTDYFLAFDLFESGMEGNDIDGFNAFGLASMYYQGLGEEKDYATAYDLYSNCADFLNYSCLHMEGYMLFMGEGCERDIDSGLAKLTKAAQMGNGSSMVSLCDIYFRGINGVNQNFNLAYS